jgi:hypothetical protein
MPPIGPFENAYGPKKGLLMREDRKCRRALAQRNGLLFWFLDRMMLGGPRWASFEERCQVI